MSVRHHFKEVPDIERCQAWISKATGWNREFFTPHRCPKGYVDTRDGIRVCRQHSKSKELHKEST